MNRRRFWPSGIVARIVATYGLLAVVMILLLAGFDRIVAIRYAEDRAIAEMTRLIAQKSAEMARWVNDREQDIAELADTAELQTATAILVAPQTGAAERDGAAARVAAQMRRLLARGQYIEFMLLDAATGQVIASTDANKLGTYREDRPFFRKGREAVGMQSPAFDFERKAPMMVLSGPVRVESGQTLAVIAGTAGTGRLEQIVAPIEVERDSVRVFLVNKAHLFVTAPDDQAPGDVLRRVNFAEPVAQCLEGRSGVAQAPDWRGIPVIAAYRWLPEHQLCMVAEIDAAQSVALANELDRLLLAGALVVLVIGIAISWVLGRRIAAPIVALAAASRELGAGRLDIRLAEGGRDELGALARGFNQMAESLQRRAAELVQSREELALALANMDHGLVRYDARRRVVFFNPRFCAITGISPEVLNAAPLVTELRAYFVTIGMAAQQDVDQLEADRHQAVATGSGMTTLLRLLDGRMLEVRFEPTPDGGAVVTYVDITASLNQRDALAAARDAADRANRAKSDFLAAMSHELRTPMNAILGFAQLLQIEKFGTLTLRQKEFVATLLQSGEHLLNLINDVLELSKIEAGRMDLTIEPVALVPLIASVEATLAGFAEARGITFLPTEGVRGAPAVLADRTRIAQVLINLGSNAIKYNARGGTVRITCAGLPDGWVRLAVTDTGRGIPADRQAELFQPFNRLGAEQGPIEGTGIGLSLSRRMVDLMGGRLGFSSQLEQGSVFWVDLPAVETAPSLADDGARANGLPLLKSNLLVLYVEDNPSNLRLMRSIVETLPGARLLEAPEAALGLELARGHQPDLIVLDIALPDMDGYTLLNQLRVTPETAAIPVIALSASAMPADIERGLAAGFLRYLTKPVKMQELFAAITEIAPPPTGT